MTSLLTIVMKTSIVRVLLYHQKIKFLLLADDVLLGWHTPNGVR